MNFENDKKLEQIKKTQVIYAWNYLTWGGAQIHYLALIKEVRRKFDVKILLPEGSDEQLLKFINEAKIPFQTFSPAFIVPQAGGLKNKLKLHIRKIKSEYAMLKKLETMNLDQSIVHIELAPWQSLFALIWLSLRTNVFITMHNSLPKVPFWRLWLWKIKLGIISHFKTFIPFSSNKDSRNYFKKLYSEKKYEEIEVTYTSVDPLEIEEGLNANIKREELLHKYNIPQDKFLVFCVGQFIDRKGRWVFLDAAKELLSSNRDLAFVWVSNSKPSNEDIKKAEQYNLEENLIFITSDQVGENHLDLFKLLRLADVFVLASYQEGLPISLLEAMALKIPSISTNVNAIPEAVKHLETGWLIEAGDNKGLANAIKTLKDDENLRRKLADSGSQYVLENFNDYAVGKIALNVYKNAVN